MPEQMCHCGQPLHYNHPGQQAAVEILIERYGEYVPVTVRTRTWLVPRHYIALHGIKAKEIATLGFEEITGADRS